MFDRFAFIARKEIARAGAAKIMAVSAIAIAAHDNAAKPDAPDAGLFLNPKTARAARDQYRIPHELLRNLTVKAIQEAPTDDKDKAFKRSDAYDVVATALLVKSRLMDVIALEAAAHDANAQPRKALERAAGLASYLVSTFKNYQSLKEAMLASNARPEKTDEEKARETVLKLISGLEKLDAPETLRLLGNMALALADKEAKPEEAAKALAEARAAFAPPAAEAPAEEGEEEAAPDAAKARAMAEEAAAEEALALAQKQAARRNALAGFAEAREAARAA